MPALLFTRDDVASKSTVRGALRRLTKELCMFIRDNYGHVDQTVRDHMANVVFFSRVSGAGLILYEVYKEYIMPVHKQVFMRNIDFFRNVDQTQYHAAADGNGEYVADIFDAFGLCYDTMDEKSRDYVWNVLESIVVLCQNYENL